MIQVFPSNKCVYIYCYGYRKFVRSKQVIGKRVIGIAVLIMTGEIGYFGGDLIMLNLIYICNVF